MHIVQVYHAKVPVALYGGMERVIETLCEGFIELGHQVTLIAYQGDYKIPGIQFISLDHFQTKDDAVHGYIDLIPADADVVHFHVPWNHGDFPFPQVTTMHGNLSPNESAKKLPPHTVFISKRHAQNHQSNDFIYHGYNPKSIPYNECSLEDRKYYSFLGRASLKRKGLHTAKRLVKDLDSKLQVGGGRGISLGRIKYLGQLNNQEKYKMLSGSKALLFPIEWEEPFGLVQIEAMFCGTPVWGFERGSVPELLSLPGSENLFICAKNYHELLSSANLYDFKTKPSFIRAYAEKHFGHLQMCRKYIEYYKEIL